LNLGISVKGEIQRVARLLGGFVGECTQTKGGAHLRNLQLELAVVGTIEVNRLATILILAKLGKDDSGSIEISRLLN